MRINRYIAAAGICSRRKAEQLIRDGRVKVNGEVIDQLGTMITNDDEVMVDSEVIKKTEGLYCYVFHKPVGVVTTMKDKHAEQHIGHYTKNLPVRVFPVGRLDKLTSGLLLLTNDGDFSHQLMHPKHEIRKYYRVTINGKLSNDDRERLTQGIDIGTYITKPAEVLNVKYHGEGSTFSMVIHEGKNRQIRRMVSALGHKVIALHRYQIGPISLGSLAAGDMTALNTWELKMLKEACDGKQEI